MKFVLAGVAVVAAIAALVFRPPWGERVAPVPTAPPDARSSHRGSDAGTDRAERAAERTIVVYVAGEVVAPGVYTIATGARVQAALARAGGPKPDADLVAVNLAALLEDGQEIVVPPVSAAGVVRPAGSRIAHRHARHVPQRHHYGHRSSAASMPGRGQDAQGTAPALRSIDLNTADESRLQTIPGIGPALAERIVAYRESNGPFGSVDELADVAGISARLQDEIAPYVIVHE